MATREGHMAPIAVLTGLLTVLNFVVSAGYAQAPVSIRENDQLYTLDNGIVTAQVSKRSGELTSLQCKGMEMPEFKSGHVGGYWSHDTTGGTDLISKVTIDPQSNSGARAEMSVKGISGGRKMGRGAGAVPDGDFPARVCENRAAGGCKRILHFPFFFGLTCCTNVRYSCCTYVKGDRSWVSVNCRV
jgi:hypothetical protein